jgi:tetrahydromethanopterin S-methyltransferase subunit G
MATRNEQWLEDLDDLINRVPDLYMPPAVRDNLMSRLEELQEEVEQHMTLRSTEWEA